MLLGLLIAVSSKVANCKQQQSGENPKISHMLRDIAMSDWLRNTVSTNCFKKDDFQLDGTLRSPTVSVDSNQLTTDIISLYYHLNMPLMVYNQKPVVPQHAPINTRSPSIRKLLCSPDFWVRVPVDDSMVNGKIHQWFIYGQIHQLKWWLVSFTCSGGCTQPGAHFRSKFVIALRQVTRSFWSRRHRHFEAPDSRSAAVGTWGRWGWVALGPWFLLELNQMG